jgi:hypothetical protein
MRGCIGDLLEMLCILAFPDVLFAKPQADDKQMTKLLT